MDLEVRREPGTDAQIAISVYEGYRFLPRHVILKLRYYPRLQRAAIFVHARMKTGVTLADAADHICMESSSFSRYFKEKAGINFMQFVRVAKMSEAVRMLEQYHVTSLELADDLGFQNVGTFVRMFKAIVGVTPSEYKRQYIRAMHLV